MQLPWPSLLLLVVPPAALFALALVHLLRAPRDDQPPTESGMQDTHPPQP